MEKKSLTVKKLLKSLMKECMQVGRHPIGSKKFKEHETKALLIENEICETVINLENSIKGIHERFE